MSEMIQTKATDCPVTDYSDLAEGVLHVHWDLGDECRLSVGRDGADGPWVVYVGLDVGQRDIYCEVTPHQLIEFADEIQRLIAADPECAGQSVLPVSTGEPAPPTGDEINSAPVPTGGDG